MIDSIFIPKAFGALLVLICFSCSTQSAVEKGNDVWLDSALNFSTTQNIVVWFEDQYLDEGDSFLKKASEFNGRPRRELRKEIVSALKNISDESFRKINDQLITLESSGQVLDIRQHWVINGFSCTVSPEGLSEIQRLDGVWKIFFKPTRFAVSGSDMGPEFLDLNIKPRFDLDKIEAYPWNIEKIGAVEVWNKYGITGEGTLNIVHDFGFRLDTPPLSENIYRNIAEIPNNNIDDDNNGYIDDYHGFHFDEGSADLNTPIVRKGSIIHGNVCAAVISGTFETNSKKVIGVAPGSKWAPVIGTSNIEQAVEWAIEQGADTYSMSFSQPNLGEYRTHWRKIMEHGTLCGVVFISGAGNFAAGANEASIPIQMRNPEDIPNVVLGVAGIGEDGQRPNFSSQGPVNWDTEHYKDGVVAKPDFATFNYKIPCIDIEGYLSNTVGGNSFAGPHMAGIVSLMFSANPDLLPWEIREILVEIAEDIGDPGFDYQSGHGFVNAYDAVKVVIDM